MNEVFAQIVPANSFQAADGAETPAPSVSRLSKPSSGKRPIFRLDLRRSFQMHHRLVLGPAVIGLALATIYLLDSWSIRAGGTTAIAPASQPAVVEAATRANAIAPRVSSPDDSYAGEQILSANRSDIPAASSDPSQPSIWLRNDDNHPGAPDASNIEGSSRTAAVEDSAASKAQNTSDTAVLQRGDAAVDAAPPGPVQGSDSGLANLAAAAVAPPFAADFGVVRNAIALLFSFIFLGGAVAVVAHRTDPKVYIAADVERLLGCAPMALLPDFSEVPDEIVEVQLLRLAAGIERTFTVRNLRNCVFTGAGRGVGVTTVATRVKELMETLGKAAVIVDGTGTSAFAAGRGEQEAAKQADPLGALRQAVEGQSGRGGMVFADSSPLTESTEAEQLVRAADCAIVVIESGVTTRAQLRAVASSLQRIKATAVGFVLNRVQLSKADPSFRRSIKEMGRQLRDQGQNTDWQMLRTLRNAIEEGRAGLNLDSSAADQPAIDQPAKTAAIASPFEKVLHADSPLTIFEAEPAATAELPESQFVPSAAHTPAGQPQEEIPPPPVEATAHFDPALLWPETHTRQFPQAMSNNLNGYELEQEMARTAMEGDRRITLPRLSDLRGMHFSQALKVLDMTRHPAPPSAEVELLMRAIAPYEGMFAQEGYAQNGAQQEATQAQSESLSSMRAFVTVPEPGIGTEAMNDVDDTKAGSQNASPEQQLLPVKPGLPLKRGRRTNGGQARHEHNGDAQMPGGVLDSMQILPSQHGQYKRRD